MHQCERQDIYNKTLQQLDDIFSIHAKRLSHIEDIALKVKEKIEGINPFVQQSTEIVCPKCREICCIGKHGYYNYEDLIYLYALGMKPPLLDFCRRETDPCQFLSENGCSLERSVRPSGCNWYFCNSLYDHMEQRHGYEEFDDSLRDVAGFWMKMIEAFRAGTEAL